MSFSFSCQGLTILTAPTCTDGEYITYVYTHKENDLLCVCILGFPDLFVKFVVQANAAIAGIDSCCVILEPGESKLFD